MNFYGSTTEQKGDSNWGSESSNWPSLIESRQHLSNRLNWDWKNRMILSHQPTDQGYDDDRQAQTTTEMIDSLCKSCTGMNNPSWLTSNMSQHQVGVFNAPNLSNVPTLKCSSNFPDYPSLAARAVNVGCIRTPCLDERNLMRIFSMDKAQQREGEIYPTDGPASIGLNLGVRTYFSTQHTVEGRFVRRPRLNSTGTQVPRCQAEGCNVDLSAAKHYHRRHKVCEHHSKAENVITCGLTQRFCQQCSRFHVLSEFDDSKRSCRKRLAEHNKRRRKPQTTSITTGIRNPESLALKKEYPDLSGIACSGDLQPSINTPSPNTQALLSAISVSPSVALSLNMKRQVPTLPVREQASMYSYLQGQRHTGSSLSLSTDVTGEFLENPPQHSMNQNYNEIGLSCPWQRSSTRSDSDTNGIAGHLDFPRHLLSSNTYQIPHAYECSISRGDELSPCIQNIAIEPARDISDSDWVMGREHYAPFNMNVPGSSGRQLSLSLHETPTTVITSLHNYRRQEAEVEFLHQPRVSSKCTNDSLLGNRQQSNVQFSEFQNVSEFGTSILY